ncbi:MAG TPA: cytochrome c [Candidatus Acidoferrales bacterium]|nr:cytochrome c [Candidatus Acidoferrales bacterium]
MRRVEVFAAICAIAFGIAAFGQGNQNQLHLGHPPTPEQMRRWGITVLPDGTGLPAGSGTAAEGQIVYADKCSGCHGDHGEGREPLGMRLVGGFGTLRDENPVLTVGSYWPYATTVWDYIYRAMPYAQPGTLTAKQAYSLTAYLLYMNKIIGRNDVMNRKTLAKVRMPNRDGFVPDPRPDVSCPQNKK